MPFRTCWKFSKRCTMPKTSLEICQEWNAKYPKGTLVRYWPGIKRSRPPRQNANAG